MAASFWDRVGGFFSRKDVGSSLELFRQIYGSGREAKSGVVVTTERALQVATVLACVRVLANGVAQVPLNLMQDVGDTKRVASDHPLYRLLYRRPNDWQTSYDFRETIMFHLALAGNAFVFKNKVGAARAVRELIPIEPGRVTVKRGNDYSLSYIIRADDNTTQTFPAEAIWHIRGPSWNTWMGLEATKLARESIGLTIALEDNQAEFHANGAKASGLLSVENTLTPERYNLLAGWIDKYIVGGERHQKPMILDSGAKFSSMSMTGVDAQVVETRRLQVEEVCRVFGVIPLMIGQADKTATYASVEQFLIAHVTHTMAPWYQRLEQSAEVNLLTEKELDDGYYVNFNANGLMRGAAVDRSQYYSTALGMGGGKPWMTQNEVRSREDLDKNTDPEADKLTPPVAPDKPTPAAGGAQVKPPKKSDPEPEGS